jgi:hypothetical protein
LSIQDYRFKISSAADLIASRFGIPPCWNPALLEYNLSGPVQQYERGYAARTVADR